MSCLPIIQTSFLSLSKMAQPAFTIVPNKPPKYSKKKKEIWKAMTDKEGDMSSIVLQPQSSLSLYSPKNKNMNFLNSRIYPSLYRYLPITPSTQSLSMFFFMGFFGFSHSPSSFSVRLSVFSPHLPYYFLFLYLSIKIPSSTVFYFFAQVLIFQFEQVNKNKGFFGFFEFLFYFS